MTAKYYMTIFRHESHFQCSLAPTGETFPEHSPLQQALVGLPGSVEIIIIQVRNMQHRNCSSGGSCRNRTLEFHKFTLRMRQGTHLVQPTVDGLKHQGSVEWHHRVFLGHTLVIAIIWWPKWWCHLPHHHHYQLL